MKKIILIFLIMSAAVMQSYAQDTVKHITSGCLGSLIPTDSLPCPEGVHFKYYNDTLEIYGTIAANCCGEHFVVINKQKDSIYITSLDTGILCFCECFYCFDIKIKTSTNDTIVDLNGKLYDSDVLTSINELRIENGELRIYPNPANSLLVANYSLLENSSLNISLYDITGREVVHIINENQTKGEHLIKINTEKLENGIYILKFTSNDFIGTKKIVVQH